MALRNREHIVATNMRIIQTNMRLLTEFFEQHADMVTWYVKYELGWEFGACCKTGGAGVDIYPCASYRAVGMMDSHTRLASPPPPPPSSPRQQTLNRSQVRMPH